MKNFFKTSLYLAAFAFAGIMFQISCSNSDEAAQANASGKIIYTLKDAGEVQSIWTCDLDGSNQAQIPITLPAGKRFYRLMGTADHTNAKLSPDGQTVVFTLQNIGDNSAFIYSCDISGENMQELVQIPAENAVYVGNLVQ